MPPAEAWVETVSFTGVPTIVGLALAMTTDSLGAPHAEVAALLLASPLYTAVQK